ncbi:MAG: anti-sigma F factor [Eubacteriales bacterium]|nr:anti-sigma F factor [Eubacteriales bacterium]MDD4582612.1 anti-sigma F factor [Eubacteriales bacterium]
MEYTNQIKLEMWNRSENEALARTMAAAFAAQLDPTVEELTEIKTAISEAVSNAIIHGYKKDKNGIIRLELSFDQSGKLIMLVEDQGVGIEDIEKAMEPLFTTGNSEERSGMGFTVMESFMDKVLVESKLGEGTRVTLIKMLDRAYGF